jgi:hypothetical protein
MDNEYYMLKVEGKGNPSKVHLTLEEAQDEAERLCHKENCPVDVLVATYRCVPTQRHTGKILDDLHTGTITEELVEETLDRLVDLHDLVDGAYTTVELYKPSTPSGKKWREDWLAKAKSFGADTEF